MKKFFSSKKSGTLLTEEYKTPQVDFDKELEKLNTLIKEINRKIREAFAPYEKAVRQELIAQSAYSSVDLLDLKQKAEQEVRSKNYQATLNALHVERDNLIAKIRSSRSGYEPPSYVAPKG